MSSPKKNAVVMIVALMQGCILYILLRPNSYIAIVACYFIPDIDNSIFTSFLNCRFLKYYFPDYLWGLALACGLQAIFRPRLKGSVICCLFAVTYGVVWEVGQYFKLINGTGDLVDVIMYLSAGFTGVLINLKEILV